MVICTIDGKECKDVQFFSSAANCKKWASPLLLRFSWDSTVLGIRTRMSGYRAGRAVMCARPTQSSRFD